MPSRPLTKPQPAPDSERSGPWNTSPRRGFPWFRWRSASANLPWFAPRHTNCDGGPPRAERPPDSARTCGRAKADPDSPSTPVREESTARFPFLPTSMSRWQEKPGIPRTSLTRAAAGLAAEICEKFTERPVFSGLYFCAAGGVVCEAAAAALMAASSFCLAASAFCSNFAEAVSPVAAISPPTPGAESEA